MGTFRILSLDGGGIRGAFTAAFLAELEQLVGRPIGEHFDLIAGTSTGAIIAVALSLGERAERIRQFYESRGAKIFTRRPPAELSFLQRIGRRAADRFLRPHGLDLDYLLESKYESLELAKALKEVFGGRTLEKVKRRLVVPAVDLARGTTVVFKTPHIPEMTRDGKYLATDVVLASAAAPTYFPHATIDQGSSFCDGGLWANNPAMVAYAEAVKIQRCCKRENVDACFELDDIQMLSVGTGCMKYSIVPPEQKSGLAWWGPHIIDTMSLSQSQGVEFQAKYILDVRHHRVNFDIPDSSWRLDSVELLERFFHFGKTEAHSRMAALRPVFFASTAAEFTPFTPG